MSQLAPALEPFLSDVLHGLQRSPQKELPSKYLYDERGSQLFDEICELDEYYPTRTEVQIMDLWSDEMLQRIGPNALLVEYGSGSSMKTQVLLDHAQELAAYVPVDISRDYLLGVAERLSERYPRHDIHPVCADFTRPFALPLVERPVERTVVYFPGSTIGNLLAKDALNCLDQMSEQVGSGGGLLIGVDLDKDPELLHAAYNDAQGVTAAFNLNLLERINRELGADFDLDAFRHEGRHAPDHSRMEMHLVSDRDQEVAINGTIVEFVEGETIRTEYSHKYTPQRFAELAQQAGWRQEQVWIDPNQLFSVQYFTVE